MENRNKLTESPLRPVNGSPLITRSCRQIEIREKKRIIAKLIWIHFGKERLQLELIQPVCRST